MVNEILSIYYDFWFTFVKCYIGSHNLAVPKTEKCREYILREYRRKKHTKNDNTDFLPF